MLNRHGTETPRQIWSGGVNLSIYRLLCLLRLNRMLKINKYLVSSVTTIWRDKCKITLYLPAVSWILSSTCDEIISRQRRCISREVQFSNFSSEFCQPHMRWFIIRFIWKYTDQNTFFCCCCCWCKFIQIYSWNTRLKVTNNNNTELLTHVFCNRRAEHFIQLDQINKKRDFCIRCQRNESVICLFYMKQLVDHKSASIRSCRDINLREINFELNSLGFMTIRGFKYGLYDELQLSVDVQNN